MISPLRLGYLALSLAAAATQIYLLSQLVPDQGSGPSGLSAIIFATQQSADVRIATAALALWALAETLVRKNWLALTAIPASLCLGIGCGLPLYLFLRTRPVT